MKIFCSAAPLRQFRAECKKRFPNEHLAALFGNRFADGSVHVTRIAPIDHRSTPDIARPTNDGILRSKKAALRKDEEWLGTIHSHCFRVTDPCCWHLSPADIESAMQYGETVCGLVYVFDRGKKTSVYWYVPQPLPEVVYT